MNSQQIKHAVSRIDAILALKLSRCKEPNRPVRTDLDKLNLLQTGRFSVDVTKYERYGWTNAIVFPEVEGMAEYLERCEEIERYKAELREEAARIKDDLVLGDSEAALQMLQDFAARPEMA